MSVMQAMLVMFICSNFCLCSHSCVGASGAGHVNAADGSVEVCDVMLVMLSF